MKYIIWPIIKYAGLVAISIVLLLWELLCLISYIVWNFDTDYNFEFVTEGYYIDKETIEIQTEYEHYKTIFHYIWGYRPYKTTL